MGELGGRAGQRDQIGTGPAGAAAEHDGAVDTQCKARTVSAALDLDAAKSHWIEFDALACEFECQRMPLRRAVRMWPPARDVWHMQRAGQRTRIRPL